MLAETLPAFVQVVDKSLHLFMMLECRSVCHFFMVCPVHLDSLSGMLVLLQECNE